jgi:hypothetical protein
MCTQIFVVINPINDSGLQLNMLYCNIVLKPFSILIESTTPKISVGLLEYLLSSILEEDNREKKILQSLDIWMKPHDEVWEWWNMHTDRKV